MIRSLDAGKATQLISDLLQTGTGSLRKDLMRFAQETGSSSRVLLQRSETFDMTGFLVQSHGSASLGWGYCVRNA